MNTPFQAGRKVVIYEQKNGWVRVSKFIDREKIITKFPGEFLPQTVALWIKISSLPASVAENYKSTEKPPRKTVSAKPPPSVPVPVRRPADIEQSSAKAVQKPEPVEKPEEPQTASAEPKAVEQAALQEDQPEPQDASPALPAKLTRQLKDQRLSKLPLQPDDTLDLKSVIAIRHHALQLLEDGECKAISAGGKSLSLDGWIYVVCQDDGQYRQFAVE